MASFLNNLTGNGVDQKTRSLNVVSRWVLGLIAKDKRLGRSQSDFPTKGLEQKLNENILALKNEGVDFYQGGGNIFHSKMVNGVPIIVQTRALAQRVVKLDIRGG